jgi:hypothetical protein
VRLSRFFGLERIDVVNAVATQATIKTRARGLRAKKFAGDGQQIIQVQQQHLSEFDHDLFLRGCDRMAGVARAFLCKAIIRDATHKNKGGAQF